LDQLLKNSEKSRVEIHSGHFPIPRKCPESKSASENFKKMKNGGWSQMQRTCFDDVKIALHVFFGRFADGDLGIYIFV
jgi:hypothetical protein